MTAAIELFDDPFPIDLGRGVLVGRRCHEAMVEHYRLKNSIQVIAKTTEPRPDYEAIVANIARARVIANNRRRFGP